MVIRVAGNQGPLLTSIRTTPGRPSAPSSPRLPEGPSLPLMPLLPPLTLRQVGPFDHGLILQPLPETAKRYSEGVAWVTPTFRGRAGTLSRARRDAGRPGDWD